MKPPKPKKQMRPPTIRELVKEATKAPKVEAAPPPVPAISPEQVKKWKKALAATEEKMATLNTEGAALEAKLSTNPHPSEIAEAGKRLKLVNQELKNLEDQWLELSAQLES